MTILKKNTYFQYQMDISDIVKMRDFKSGILGEYLFDVFAFAGDHVYGSDSAYWVKENKPAIIEYLKNQKLTDKEIVQYDDEIEDTILQSIANAYRDACESDLQDQLHADIETRCDDIGLNWKYTGDCKYSAESVTFYATKKGLLQWAKEFFISCWSGKESVYDSIACDSVSYFWENCQDEIGDLIYDSISGKVEPDSRQDSYASDKAVLDMFKEYNEIEYSIKQDRKNKTIKLKNMIKNHVPLEYRVNV